MFITLQGALGNGVGIGTNYLTIQRLPSPPSSPILTGATALSAAGFGVCALIVTGGLSCWGSYTSSTLYLFTLNNGGLQAPPNFYVYPPPSPSASPSLTVGASASPTISYSSSAAASETQTASPSSSLFPSPSPPSSPSPSNGFTFLATGSYGVVSCGISTYSWLFCWVSFPCVDEG